MKTQMIRGSKEYYQALNEKSLKSSRQRRARLLKKWLEVGLPALAAKRPVLRRDWPKGLKHLCGKDGMLCQSKTSKL